MRRPRNASIAEDSAKRRVARRVQSFTDERKCFMKRLLSMLVAVALGGCFATVGRDGRVVGGEAAFTLSLPVVLPPLIVVQPGVSVARDMDDEVFYADGYYWARQDQRW